MSTIETSGTFKITVNFFFLNKISNPFQGVYSFFQKFTCSFFTILAGKFLKAGFEAGFEAEAEVGVGVEVGVEAGVEAETFERDGKKSRFQDFKISRFQDAGSSPLKVSGSGRVRPC